jgi:hypothetical protein
MRKLVIVVAVLAGIGYGAKYFYSNWVQQYAVSVGSKSEAKSRIERIILNMQDGTLEKEETALAIWAANKISLSWDEAKYFEPLWIKFWTVSGLGDRSGWEVSAMEVFDEDESPWVKVTLSSGSSLVHLKVEQGKPIELFRNGAPVPYKELKIR